jgi:hypothetical protein
MTSASATMNKDGVIYEILWHQGDSCCKHPTHRLHCNDRVIHQLRINSISRFRVYLIRVSLSHLIQCQMHLEAASEAEADGLSSAVVASKAFRYTLRLRKVTPSLCSNRVHRNGDSQDAKVAKVEDALHPARKAMLNLGSPKLSTLPIKSTGQVMGDQG